MVETTNSANANHQSVKFLMFLYFTVSKLQCVYHTVPLGSSNLRNYHKIKQTYLLRNSEETKFLPQVGVESSRVV